MSENTVEMMAQEPAPARPNDTLIIVGLLALVFAPTAVIVLFNLLGAR